MSLTPDYSAKLKYVRITTLSDTGNHFIDHAYALGGIDILYNSSNSIYSYRNDETLYTTTDNNVDDNTNSNQKYYPWNNGIYTKGVVATNGNLKSIAYLVKPNTPTFQYAPTVALGRGSGGNVLEFGFDEEVPFTEFVLLPPNWDNDSILRRMLRTKVELYDKNDNIIASTTLEADVGETGTGDDFNQNHVGLGGVENLGARIIVISAYQNLEGKLDDRIQDYLNNTNLISDNIKPSNFLLNGRSLFDYVLLDTVNNIYVSEPDSDPEPTITGNLIDGYISGANGGLYDVNDLNTAIETFVTDSYGKYEIYTSVENLPDVYTIKFSPGGTNITTGEIVATELTSSSSKSEVQQSGTATLNVTPITSIVTKILTETTGTIDASSLESSISVVKNVFDITDEEITKDFIAEGDTNITKLVTQIETTSKSLATAINDSNVTEEVILDSIVKQIIESNNNNEQVDFANSTNITNIIEQVETDNSITVNNTVTTNAASLISQVNTKVEEIAQDNTKSFTEIVTESTQLSVSTNESLTGNNPDNTIDLTDTNIVIENIVNNIETASDNITINDIFQPEPEVVSNICFPAGTEVYTDQGNITIEKLVPGVNTINNKEIVTITKTVMTDDKLVKINKNAISKNIPNKDTTISGFHKVKINSKFIEAYKLPNLYKDIKYIPYNGEVLYNVLMENWETMKVHNMEAETLHPDNIVAKLHNSKLSKDKKLQLLGEINKAVINEDYEKFDLIKNHILN